MFLKTIYVQHITMKVYKSLPKIPLYYNINLINNQVLSLSLSKYISWRFISKIDKCYVTNIYKNTQFLIFTERIETTDNFMPLLFLKLSPKFYQILNISHFQFY